MKKLELFLIEEIEGKKESTFIYQLHELDVFDEKMFNNLISKSYEYFNSSTQISEQYIFIVKGLFKIFLHMFFLFSCHHSPNDIYKIKNYSKTLKDKICEIYFKVSDIISKIGN